MAETRHCDRSGCQSTEPCGNTRFLTMSPEYGHHPLQRFCSWACLSAEAVDYAEKEAMSKARSLAALEAYRADVMLASSGQSVNG